MPAVWLVEEGGGRSTFAAIKAIAADAEIARASWSSVSRRANAFLRRAGHILSAASIQLDWNGTTVVFSGDLGRYNDATMAAVCTENLNPDVVVMKSAKDRV